VLSGGRNRSIPASMSDALRAISSEKFIGRKLHKVAAAVARG
jgi:hypothetical protein